MNGATNVLVMQQEQIL